MWGAIEDWEKGEERERRERREKAKGKKDINGMKGKGERTNSSSLRREVKRPIEIRV